MCALRIESKTYVNLDKKQTKAKYCIIMARMKCNAVVDLNKEKQRWMESTSDQDVLYCTYQNKKKGVINEG